MPDTTLCLCNRKGWGGYSSDLAATTFLMVHGLDMLHTHFLLLKILWKGLVYIFEVYLYCTIYHKESGQPILFFLMLIEFKLCLVTLTVAFVLCLIWNIVRCILFTFSHSKLMCSTVLTISIVWYVIKKKKIHISCTYIYLFSDVPVTSKSMVKKWQQICLFFFHKL